MEADFYVAEYGDVLSITLGFDASAESQTVEMRVRKPEASVSVVWGGATATATAVNRTIAQNDLDVAGVYHGEVVVTRPSPLRVRIVRFTLNVGERRAP